MMRALIVDDEPPARHRLRSLLRDETDVTVIAECGTVAEAVGALKEHQPDLIFLDVRMPGDDGFALATHLRQESVIFVSAFSEHALRAFDVDAVDYLMKPFSRERLIQAVERARSRKPANAPLKRLPVDVGRLIRLVETEHIDLLRSEGNYVRVRAAGQTYLVRDSLTSLCTRLDASVFVRVHRSAAVNLGKVREVETLPHGELVLRLADGSSVITGRAYRVPVRKALGLRP